MYQREIASPQATSPYNFTGDTFATITGTLDTTGGTFVPDPTEDTTKKTCILFVHGFNQTYNGSTTFAETMFKRLWWRGYKVRYAAFRWPTFGNGTDLIGGAVGTYNNSEYEAWNSGSALKLYVQLLSAGGYSVVVAHSMGNLVVGEALREGAPIHYYAMLHAATAAECYSNGTYTFPTTQTFQSNVPNNDADPGTRSLTYKGWLGGIGGADQATPRHG